MIKGVHHVGLSVSNLDQAVADYGAVAGLTEIARFTVENTDQARRLMGLPSVSAKVALLKGVNACLELFEFAVPAPGAASSPPVNAPGITHVCAQGRSIDDLYASLIPQGFSFPESPVDLGTGFLYAYGRSRDGAVIETEGAPFAQTEPASWMGHVAFATHDLERLVAFYAALLGMEPQFSPRLRGSARYDRVTGLRGVDVLAAWVRGSNLALEFWQYLSPETVARSDDRPVSDLGYSQVAFEVDDLEAVFARAVELGARPHGPPEDLGRARAAYLRDPDGNVLELITWAPGAEALSVSALSHPRVLEAVSRDHQKLNQKQDI
jgi:catechol 2,3-dioxygenase-like lactoylglutathione lyase family enzyme